jgi:N-succinyldiaminopimelate aminotransferase
VWQQWVRERGAAWVTASREPVAAVRTTKQFLTYVASGPFQYAIAEALALPDPDFTAYRRDLQTKRNLLTAGLTDAGFQVYTPQGTYLITTDIAELALTAGRTQVRFTFCKQEKVLAEAAARLREASGRSPRDR